MPSTNSGTDTNAKVTTELTMSNKLSRHKAAAAPTASESGRATAAEKRISRSESPTRFEMIVATDVRSSESDCPRRPVAMPDSQCQYCSTFGRFRWSC